MLLLPRERSALSSQWFSQWFSLVSGLVSAALAEWFS